MLFMNLLDWLTLVSYLALNVDIILETFRIYRTKSSNDLSIFGMTIRFAAIVIILGKFISVNDMSLIIGQALATLTFGAYFALALAYLKHGKKRV